VRSDPGDTARFLAALTDTLASAGVRDACLAPGSRSALLALLLDRHPGVRVWTHLDERSAAFFALGLARARRSPVVLLSTSGTAAANFLPALVEARQARVPLVVVTADRPWELRDVGANQAIDQTRLYGPYAKWSHELAIPPDGEDASAYARSVALRAVLVACSAPAGPVHLNVPLREPLLPPPGSLPAVASDGEAKLAVPGPRPPDPQVVRSLAGALARAERGLIVCGPQDDPRLPASCARLARATGYPVLADPLSLARSGGHDRSLMLDAYDALLRDPAVGERLAPEVVLRLGDAPTSKPLLAFLTRHAAARQVLLPGDALWNDPELVARELLAGDLRTTCDALSDAVGGRGSPTAWAEAWLDADRRTREALERWLGELDEPFEGRALADLVALLPSGATLVAGNSMPVRDLDAFVRGSHRELRLLANRGASGIDGVLSTALGVAAASDAPVVLAIGDVSFLHDLGGLIAARAHGLRATILLLNNDGGGIFSFLPAAEHRGPFERLFGTPHGCDLSAVRELFGVGFVRAAPGSDARAALGAALAGEGVSIVEVRTERERNVALHREAWAVVASAVAPVLT